MLPMYLEHFGLKEAPFSLAPDPRYLFLGAGHREALAHLLYGLESDDGFVLLSGEVGSGKTILCRCLLEQLPDDCDVALIVYPRLSAVELLASICEAFRIPLPAGEKTAKAYVDRLDAWLRQEVAQGRRAVLMIDEAQSLPDEALEQVRLLTNLETSRRKLLRVILVGQPALRDLLARPELRQLEQRIVARYHLGHFAPLEAAACVVHRLAVAGTRREIFARAALDDLHRLSGGVPRRLCILADRALLGAYTQWQERVESAVLLRAAQELQGLAAPAPGRSPARAQLGASAGAAR